MLSKLFYGIKYLLGLHVVYLEEALKVQVGHLILVLGAQKLGQLGIRNNATLELGIKAVVLLHVGRHELGHISLRALALGR